MWRLGHKDAFLKFWYQNRDKVDREKLKTRENEKIEKRTATLLLELLLGYNRSMTPISLWTL